MRLMVTRPEPDATRFAGQLDAAGHQAIVAPLMETVFPNRGAIELDGVQALIATSRNGLRALKRNDACARACKLPLYAVGAATAAMARNMGFGRVIAGPGRALDLVDMIAEKCRPSAGPLLHLAGEQMAVDIKSALARHKFVLIQPVLYCMRVAEAFRPDTVDAMTHGRIDGIILMSPRTAKIYVSLVAHHELAPNVRKITHFCLSEAVAGELAPLGDLSPKVPSHPNLEEMLALVNREAAQLS